MTKKSVTRIVAAVAALAFGAALTSVASPAQADPGGKPSDTAKVFVQPGSGTVTTLRLDPPAGWTCYPTKTETSAGGWCDGRGPDWEYRGTVHCSNDEWYNGTKRWFGDRRQSHRSCPVGKTVIEGGLDLFYKGAYQWTKLAEN